MMHDLGRLLTEKTLTFAGANEIAEDMSVELASLRNTGEISNDAFLEAGVIQGGISVIANMLATGANNEEIILHYQQIKVRAAQIVSTYPELEVVFT
ncbi:MAG: hypothetical protein VW551_02090 [Euryarchaeota archaeon]|jgi:hypothetical protein